MVNSLAFPDESRYEFVVYFTCGKKVFHLNVAAFFVQIVFFFKALQNISLGPRKANFLHCVPFF